MPHFDVVDEQYVTPAEFEAIVIRRPVGRIPGLSNLCCGPIRPKNQITERRRFQAVWSVIAIPMPLLNIDVFN